MSDHGHLGQILTYLAGLDAHTIVWVAPDFREAHLSAIRWLNQHTSAEFAFFAVKLRVVRIGASPLAPLFEVLERPNDWEKRLQEAVRQSSERGPVGDRRHTFWSAYCNQVPVEAARGRPNAAFYRWAQVGDTGFVLSRFLADRYVGLCIRGPRGTPVTAVAEQLSPMSEALAARLGVSFDPTADYLFIKTIPGNYVDSTERDRLITWLAEETELYAATLIDIYGEPH